ncbi:hypothetical protein AAHE18_07G029700 [Arachis hypogaea]
MANSMVYYISFLLSSVFLLSSHVLTHEQFKENTMINVNWYNPSTGRTGHVGRKGTDPFHRRRPWAEQSNPWPGHASKKPALQPRFKKNKNKAAAPPRPPPSTN